MKRRDYIVAILIGAVAGLYLTFVILQSSKSTDGITLMQLQNEITRYKVLNSDLKDQILHCESLDYIKKQAGLMGMHEATDSDYFVLR